MRPNLTVIRGGLARDPVDISPTERWRPTFPVSRDWPQHLEDAAAAADRCGQPVILAPQVVRELAFLLRIGSVA